MTIQNDNVRGLGCFIYSKGLENLFAHVNKKQEINRKLLAYKLLHGVMKYRDNMGQCHVLQSVWLWIYTLNRLIIFYTCRYYVINKWTYIKLIKYIFTLVALWKYDYLLWCLDHVTWGLVWNILIIRIQKHDRTRNERFCMTRKYELILLLIAILPRRFVILPIAILGRLYLMFAWLRKCLLRHHIPDNVFIDT